MINVREWGIIKEVIEELNDGLKFPGVVGARERMDDICRIGFDRAPGLVPVRVSGRMLGRGLRKGQGKAPAGRIIKGDHAVVGTGAVRICYDTGLGGVGRRRFMTSHRKEGRLYAFIKSAKLCVIVSASTGLGRLL